MQVIPLSWGMITTKLLALKNKLDFVIGSDLFFDPEVFEKLVFTIKWLLSKNPGDVSQQNVYSFVSFNIYLP